MSSVNITMPKLGEAMTEGILLRWHVNEGDAFHEGDILAEIEADKANMEIEAQFDGVVMKLCAAPGGAAPVDGLLAIVRREPETGVEPG
ncbi:MAG: lipoyl domain-containing protein [bacterium]|nr:lipoyl domain-containing protein [Candidatus Sumerlaeota bacterium]